KHSSTYVMVGHGTSQVHRNLLLPDRIRIGFITKRSSSTTSPVKSRSTLERLYALAPRQCCKMVGSRATMSGRKMRACSGNMSSREDRLYWVRIGSKG